VKRRIQRYRREAGRLDRMVVMGVASFERLFREAADLDVDKADLKRYETFVREKIADMLTIAEARATADGRDLVESRDLPITKGLQESIHRFRKLDVSAEVRPMLEEIATRPQLDLAVAADVDDELPEVAGGLSLALGQTFRLIDPDSHNPATEHWERAFRIFDLLL
jgi:histone H3/H4